MNFFKKLFKKRIKPEEATNLPTLLNAMIDDPLYGFITPTPGRAYSSDEEYYNTVLRAATEEQDEEARMALFICLIEGRGVQAAPRTGFSGLTFLAHEGNVDAMEYLIESYRDGIRNLVPRDDRQFQYWLEKAAAAGSYFARAELARCYRQGLHGFPKSPFDAHVWFYRIYNSKDRDPESTFFYALGLLAGYSENPEWHTDKGVFDSDRITGEALISTLADSNYGPAKEVLKQIRIGYAKGVLQQICSHLFGEII